MVFIFIKMVHSKEAILLMEKKRVTANMFLNLEILKIDKNG
jgi:hypothetical protein